MTKLTLSVDARVVARAKRYARARGTSVSGLVERMLDLAAGPPSGASDTPASNVILDPCLRGDERRLGFRGDERCGNAVTSVWP